MLYVSAVVPIRKREILYGEGSYTAFQEEVRYEFNGAKQEHSKTSVGIKIGAVKGLGGPFYYEYFAGWGIGRRNTFYRDFSDRILSADQPTAGESIGDDLLSERKCWQIDLLLGVKIGFRL